MEFKTGDPLFIKIKKECTLLTVKQEVDEPFLNYLNNNIDEENQTDDEKVVVKCEPFAEEEAIIEEELHLNEARLYEDSSTQPGSRADYDFCSSDSGTGLHKSGPKTMPPKCYREYQRNLQSSCQVDPACTSSADTTISCRTPDNRMVIKRPKRTLLTWAYKPVVTASGQADLPLTPPAETILPSRVLKRGKTPKPLTNNKKLQKAVCSTSYKPITIAPSPSELRPIIHTNPCTPITVKPSPSALQQSSSGVSSFPQGLAQEDRSDAGPQRTSLIAHGSQSNVAQQSSVHLLASNVRQSSGNQLLPVLTGPGVNSQSACLSTNVMIQSVVAPLSSQAVGNVLHYTVPNHLQKSSLSTQQAVIGGNVLISTQGNAVQLVAPGVMQNPANQLVTQNTGQLVSLPSSAIPVAPGQHTTLCYTPGGQLIAQPVGQQSYIQNGAASLAFLKTPENSILYCSVGEQRMAQNISQFSSVQNVRNSAVSHSSGGPLIVKNVNQPASVQSIPTLLPSVNTVVDAAVRFSGLGQAQTVTPFSSVQSSVSSSLVPSTVTCSDLGRSTDAHVKETSKQTSEVVMTSSSDVLSELVAKLVRRGTSVNNSPISLSSTLPAIDACAEAGNQRGLDVAESKVINGKDLEVSEYITIKEDKPTEELRAAIKDTGKMTAKALPHSITREPARFSSTSVTSKKSETRLVDPLKLDPSEDLFVDVPQCETDEPALENWKATEDPLAGAHVNEILPEESYDSARNMHCCACPNGLYDGRPLYKFPSGAWGRMWVERSGLESHKLLGLKRQFKYLCSAHFDVSCFSDRALKNRAMPTIFFGVFSCHRCISFWRSTTVKGRHCCACSEYVPESRILFNFPEDSRKEQWIRNCSIPPESLGFLSKMLICPAHFEFDCFIPGTWKGELMDTAVPTLHLSGRACTICTQEGASGTHRTSPNSSLDVCSSPATKASTRKQFRKIEPKTNQPLQIPACAEQPQKKTASVRAKRVRNVKPLPNRGQLRPIRPRPQPTTPLSSFGVIMPQNKQNLIDFLCQTVMSSNDSVSLATV